MRKGRAIGADELPDVAEGRSGNLTRALETIWVRSYPFVDNRCIQIVVVVCEICNEHYEKYFLSCNRNHK